MSGERGTGWFERAVGELDEAFTFPKGQRNAGTTALSARDCGCVFRVGGLLRVESDGCAGDVCRLLRGFVGADRVVVCSALGVDS